MFENKGISLLSFVVNEHLQVLLKQGATCSVFADHAPAIGYTAIMETKREVTTHREAGI
jgi:hypothetical protein